MGGLEDAAAQAGSLRETKHRPYPLPARQWTMGQTWQNLLFTHWRFSHDVLRPHVPRRLELEECAGSAWIGLTPFRVTGLRLRGMPPPPFVSSFYELNCRTYVRVGDHPGIWFFSLDASSAAAVAAARHVPPALSPRANRRERQFVPGRHGRGWRFPCPVLPHRQA